VNTSANDTMMWEVRAADDKVTELLAWLVATALPFLREQAGFRDADVYRSEGDRVVVITRFDADPLSVPPPPGDLVRRPAHQWPFRHVEVVRGSSALIGADDGGPVDEL
jgi:hypothetical protein